MKRAGSTTRESIMRSSLFLSLRSFGLHNESNFFIQNLAVLIGAGLGVTAALESVYSETTSVRMRSALKEVIEAVNNGSSLSQALEEARIVSAHTLTLIRLGELSGNLSANLKVAALQNEKEALFRSRVRSALAYSSFVLVTALTVGIGVAWYVLPQIADFFLGLDAPLPVLTKGIISTGIFLKTYGVFFVPGFFAVFGIIFYFLFSFPKTRFIGRSILFHTPLIKRLIMETEISRFGFLVGTMLKAGVPINTVFELMPRTTTFGNYQDLYRKMSAQIVDGSSFKKIFTEQKETVKLIPLAARQMIIASELSGTLSETFIKIGDIYEERVDATSRNIPAFLEPALLLIIGSMVALLALSIITPVYELGLYF